jgi:hypothetical protein
MILYKKDLNNNILQWYIDKDVNTLITYVGRLTGKKTHNTTIVENIDSVIQSKIHDKRKKGWKSLEDLIVDKDPKLINTALQFYNDYELQSILKQWLPVDDIDLRNRRKPQKAVLFEYEKFKYPAFLQPKLNGVRCSIAWESYIEGEGMFAVEKEGVIISSKDGNIYVMPHIIEYLTKDDFSYIDDDDNIIDITYDGELYKHGMPLNKIRASIPMFNKFGTLSKPSGNPTDIQFWCFDLAIKDVSQIDRDFIRRILLDRYPTVYSSNTFKNIRDSSIINVKSYVIENDKTAIEESDFLIAEGFEGGILRDREAIYHFGGRTKFMVKLKKWFYTKCKVLDIIEKRTAEINNKTRTYISIMLQNDINEEIFESSILGDETFRIELLENRNNHIGKIVEIRFRERSGVKKVPFQSVITKFI